MLIKLKTTPYPSGLIEQELLPEDNHIGFGYTKWVVNTREKAIKEALIALGWRPPNTQMHVDKKPCGFYHQGLKNEGDRFCKNCGMAFYE